MSAKRTQLRDAGPGEERGHRHRRISERNQPISLVRSARNWARVPDWPCPFCNTDIMSLHLAEISLAIAPGAHAVVLMDQAGWHMTDKLDIPDNISIVALPPKCPELNPVENIWQFMRDNWLSNRIFTSYENILNLCCEAWNKLVDQLWRIMTIGRRKWARRF